MTEFEYKCNLAKKYQDAQYENEKAEAALEIASFNTGGTENDKIIMALVGIGHAILALSNTMWNVRK